VPQDLPGESDPLGCRARCGSRGEGRMTAILARMRRADLERERELADLERLVREASRQRPAPEPPPLHELAERGAEGTPDAGGRRRRVRQPTPTEKGQHRDRATRSS
jgi:hypothetical protein